VSDPLSLAAAGTSGLAVLVAATAHLRFRRLRKACTLLQGGAENSSFIVAASRQAAEMERLRGEVGRLHREFEQFQVAIDESIRRIAVLRYDAFGEMGGRLSWSVALLDDLGDGVVLTALVNRSESRCYVKTLRRGVPDMRLTPEEINVVDAALKPGTRNGAVRIPGPMKPTSDRARVNG
jgi:hypothetical protein